jgi:hypothetical protein
MIYSNTQNEQLAWNHFVADAKMATKYSDKEMGDLADALKGYRKHQPSKIKMKYWVEQFGHEECVPPQLWRDSMIVDFLIFQRGYTLNDATNLWCDWEDFEYDILNTQTV